MLLGLTIGKLNLIYLPHGRTRHADAGPNKKLAANSTPADKEFCKRQIDATDAEIDALVYKLYDLTDDEIKLVEEKN